MSKPDDLPESLRRAIEEQHPGVLSGSAKRSKYNATPTEVNGIRFDSKKEAGRYKELCLLVQSGEVDYFLMQVPFWLPGNVRYRVDFQVFHADGTVVYEDVKGYRTQTYKLKKKLVEAHYPVQIEEV